MMLMATETSMKSGGTEKLDVWSARAIDLLEQAIYQLREGHDDVIPLVDAASAALRVAVGELDPTELDCVFAAEERPCICPPDLLARDGFLGGCPVHASC